jgi:hypothetical protein
MFTRATQCVRGFLDPPVSAFSLSLYRHPFLYTLFTSRFTLIINNKKVVKSRTTPHRRSHQRHLAKVGSTHVKTEASRINLKNKNNIDGDPITSRTHTHPSHSETSRLLTSSLSLGVPVPRVTQCIRDV